MGWSLVIAILGKVYRYYYSAILLVGIGTLSGGCGCAVPAILIGATSMHLRVVNEGWMLLRQ